MINNKCPHKCGFSGITKEIVDIHIKSMHTNNRKKKPIKQEWVFTKDLKDKMIIFAPHTIKVDDLPKDTKVEFIPK